MDVILHYCYKLIAVKLLTCFKVIKNLVAQFWTRIYMEYLRFDF